MQPHYCSACNKECEVSLVDVSEWESTPVIAPRSNCCDAYVLEELEIEYPCEPISKFEYLEDCRDA